MTLITWNESLETGIGMIDAQHRMLVGLLNQLSSIVDTPGSKETAESLLHNLQQYTVYHFAAEEKLMDETGYPSLEDHRALHQGFVEELEGLEIDALTEAPDLSQRMLEFLKTWLTEHILGNDMAFAATVAK